MYRKLASASFLTLLAAQAVCAQAFSIGQRVSWEDKRGDFGGGTVTGTIYQYDVHYKYASPYYIKVDGNGATKRADEWELSAASGASPAKGSASTPSAPTQLAPAATPTQSASSAAAAGQQVSKAPVQPGTAHAAGDWGRPPAPGNFKYGKTNYRPFLAWSAPTPPGLKKIYVATGAGDESPVGRWYTKTGGVWTQKGNPDRDGNQTYEWGRPEYAELINVMPNGTWQMNNFGKVTSGKWYDLGQNVIRLVNMTPGEDWTASVYDHMIQFKSEVGLAKQGNRY